MRDTNHLKAILCFSLPPPPCGYPIAAEWHLKAEGEQMPIMSFLWDAQLERKPTFFSPAHARVSHRGHLCGDTSGEVSCCFYSAHNAGVYIRSKAVIQTDTCDLLCKENKKKSCSAAGVHPDVKSSYKNSHLLNLLINLLCLQLRNLSQ